MLFTSYEFLECLIALFLLYYVLPARWQWKLLLAASFLFYFRANPVYCVYILMTILTTWFAGCRIRAAQEARDQWLKENKAGLSKEERKSYKAGVKRRTWIWTLCCLLFNLGLLAVVKYTNFVIANVNALLEAAGSGKPIGFIDIIVPLGISFYTFQSVGYIIDVYRETAEASLCPLSRLP